MRRRLLLLSIAALALAFQVPAGAQSLPPSAQGRIEMEPPGASPGVDAEAAKIMQLTLPFRDGQTLRYYDGDGNFIGFARRHGLVIEFYGADGNYLGRARRVTQAVTRYYDANGLYLGRRINQRLTLRNTDNEPALSGGGSGY